MFKEIAIGFKHNLQTASESLQNFSTLSFELVYAAVILAITLSLVLHGVLKDSHSTAPHPHTHNNQGTAIWRVRNLEVKWSLKFSHSQH